MLLSVPCLMKQYLVLIISYINLVHSRVVRAPEANVANLLVIVMIYCKVELSPCVILKLCKLRVHDSPIRVIRIIYYHLYEFSTSTRSACTWNLSSQRVSMFPQNSNLFIISINTLVAHKNK
jgi:hypothetical protein